MTDLLIENAIVVTLDPARRVIEDGAVAIAGGRVEAVGSTAAVRVGRSPKRVIDGRRKACLPGLIDCHAHAGHGLIKSLGIAGEHEERDAWGEACRQVYSHGSSEDFWAVEAMLAGLERLKAGVTTGVSLLGGGNDIHRSDDPRYAAAHLKAIEALGTRAYLAVGPGRPPYPHAFTRLEDDGSACELSFADEMAVVRATVEEWQARDHERLKTMLVSPVYHGREELDGGPVEELRAMAEAIMTLRQEKDLLLTQDGHREGSLAFTDEVLAMLGPHLLASHAVNLTEADQEAVARSDSRIVHNPSAVRSITGRCPAPELIDRGVTVAIGSDAAAPDRGYDMFRHLAQAMHYHRRHFRNPAVLPAGKALEMITIDAAKALGREDDLGSLEPGKCADLILVDLFKPHLVPIDMPIIRLAHYANAADVDTVIVGGEVLMEGRRVLSLDESEALERAELEYRLMLERSGLQRLAHFSERNWSNSGL